ncbi:MAG: TonB-dependent receptor [Elusimicrobia bacterium]|nr:TonB-dependent receptor [Elusimicrobiota bacterium]
MFRTTKLLFLLVTLLPCYLTICFCAEETAVFIGLRKEVPIEKNPVNISVINEIDIVEKNAKTAGEAMEETPGITEISKRGTVGSESTMRIRSGGDSSKQVLVMVDGRPVNDTALGFANLASIPTENIERIEILKGPASALYGANALGGAVNIITKKAVEEKPKTEVGISATNFSTTLYNMNFSAKPGKANIFLSGDKSKSTGFRKNSNYNDLNLFFKVGYDFEKSGKLNLSNGLGRSELSMAGRNYTPIDEFDNDLEREATTPLAYQKDRNYYIQLEHSLKIQETELKTNLYRDYGYRHYKDPGSASDTISKPQNSGLGIQAETAYDIILGFEGRIEKFRRSDLTIESINEKRYNHAVFIQKMFKLDKLSLTPGVRYDNNSEYENSINPRLSIVYLLNDNTKLSANVGTAFRAPTFEDLYSPFDASMWTQGNPDVESEKSIGTDLGVECKIKKVLASRLIFFYNRTKDFIEWAPTSPSGLWMPNNVSKTFSRGIEVEIENPLLEKVSQSLSYTFLESKGKAEGETYKTLQYTPKHRINYTLNYSAPAKIKTKTEITYTHKQTWEDWKTHELPGYTLFNLKISRPICQSEVFFAVKNIFNKRYVSRENYPLPGRTYWTGINMYLWN